LNSGRELEFYMNPGEHKIRPYGSESVGANLVFALPYFPCSNPTKKLLYEELKVPSPLVGEG
jgi:hypothetical protein